METLKLSHVSKSIGSTCILQPTNLEVKQGELVVIVGPSGSGKSTLLRMIAGLDELSSGTIKLNQARIDDRDPADRQIAMVFQNYALYPHLTVFSNIEFPLKHKGVNKVHRKSRVHEIAETLDLHEHLFKFPNELSGGQKQRVAIGRAMIRSPELFLFDEPLSNLDSDLRGKMRSAIRNLHRKLGSTIIYVTHDQTEAMTLADRIVVLRAGCIEQVGTPLELYEKPKSLFVARFIGSPSMNILHYKDLASITGFEAKLFSEVGHKLKSNQCIGVRPSALQINKSGCISGKVVDMEYLGDECLLYVDCRAFKEHLLVKVDSQGNLDINSTIQIEPKWKMIHIFDTDSQKPTVEKSRI